MPYNNIPIIVVLWEHVDFSGRRIVLTEDTPDLGVYGFNDMTSAIGIHPGPNYNPATKYEVSFYQHTNYRGAQLVLTPGAYPNLISPYNFNDMISSVNFNQGIPAAPTISPIPVVVELYEHINFGGKKLVVVENVPNLHTYSAFGDIVSSVKVLEGPNFVRDPDPNKRSKAKLWTDVGGRGRPIELGVGDYPNLHASHGFGDVVSSVYVNYT